MMAAERQLAIVSIIRNESMVKVENLTKEFAVSENTIRRDLTRLEQQGILRRIHGGAVLAELDHRYVRAFESREAERWAEKMAIGKKASELVSSGDTIILDAGTTTLQLARNLVDFQRLTVLTNSLGIANELISWPNIVLLLSGGIANHVSKSFFGSFVEQFFAQMHTDKLFLAASGVTMSEGLTNSNVQETAVKRSMIKAAKEIILLVDHDKFGKASLSTITPVSAIDTIVTDNKISDKIVRDLESMGIEVLVAEV